MDQAEQLRNIVKKSQQLVPKAQILSLIHI